MNHLTDHLTHEFRSALKGVIVMLCHVSYPGTDPVNIITNMDAAVEKLFSFQGIEGRLPGKLSELQNWHADPHGKPALLALIARHKGNKTAAAAELGWSLKALYEAVK